MEITPEKFIRNCKIESIMESIHEKWIPEIITSLETEKKRDKAKYLLAEMSKIILLVLDKKN